MQLNGIIAALLNLLGLSYPQTIQDMFWCVIVLVVGLYVIKYCMIFILGLMREIMRIN